LPPFLLIWAGGALVAILHLAIIKDHLQGIEAAQVSAHLDNFLSQQQQQVLLGSPRLEGGQLPGGLLFIRVIEGAEQTILVGPGGEEIEFSKLAELARDLRESWFSIGLESGREKMIAAETRSFADGVIVQAGKASDQSHRLYQKLRRDTLLAVILFGLVAWPLSLFFVSQSLAPLAEIQARVRRLMTSHTATLLPEEGGGPELDALSREINGLLQQNRRLLLAIQQSLDNVAHDLRTPMTRLRSVAEYGLQSGDEERLRDALSDCLEESERLLKMLGIMMSVAEAESGTMRLERKEMDLNASLSEVCTLYDYVAEEKDLEIIIAPSPPIKLVADAARLTQVWANLLDNAIKYGRKGGWVKISTVLEEGSVVVVFADNGIGISANEQPKIWERLYRGDRSRSEPGLGLGLNFVKAVVEAHDGTVGVESTIHQGSRFRVQIPAYSATTQEKSQMSGE
jgi:signal transduction histidine kinase